MGAFVISKRLDKNYKFTFTSRRGKIIFTSISCKQKSDCEMIIDAIKNELESFSLTRKKNQAGKFFFRLSRGGFVLANSRKYSTELMLQKGIDQFLKYLPMADTLDFSEDDAIFADADSEELIQT